MRLYLMTIGDDDDDEDDIEIHNDEVGKQFSGYYTHNSFPSYSNFLESIWFCPNEADDDQDSDDSDDDHHHK